MSEEHDEQEQDDRIGLLIQDKYRVERKIGEGGMGAVYEGEHTLIGRRVAIKFIHADFAKEKDIVARFQREARAATAIGHEHIVEVTDMGTLDDGSVFMVLEYLEGRDLDALIDTGPLPLGRAVRIVLQVCDALGAAHEKGIIHRDLKPANIFLVDRPGRPDFVKVLDFGVAKKVTSSDDRTALTQTGAAVGTPAYMAPEQASGEKDVDHRIDIYALGVLLFEALAQRRPFVNDVSFQLLLSIVTEPPPPICSFRPDLPQAFEEVMECLLAKYPGDRYPDCAAVRKALESFAEVDDEPQLLDMPDPMAAGGATSSPTRTGRTNRPSGTAPTAAAVRPGAPRGEGDEEERPPVGASPSKASTVVAKGSAATPPPESLAPTVRPSQAAPRRPGKNRTLVAGLAGLVVVAVLAGSYLTFRNSGDVDGESSGTPVVDPEPAPSEPSTETVHIRIDTEPPGADLFLDGAPIANPFDGEMEKQAAPRRLEARLVGHEPVEKSLSLRFSQRIRLSLSADLPPPELTVVEPEPAPTKAHRPSPTKAPRGGRGSAAPAEDPSSPAAPVKTATPAPPPAPEPTKVTPPTPVPSAPPPSEEPSAPPLKRVTF